MKVKTSKPVKFQPVSITLVFESQKELDAMTAVAARTKKIPEAMFHEERYSRSVQSLEDRGIEPKTIELLLTAMRNELLAVGGKP